MGAVKILRYGDPSPMLNIYGGGWVWPLTAFLRTAAPDAWRSPTPWAIAEDPAKRDLIVAARVWSAIVSTATVAVVFVAGRALSGDATGLVAALLLASCTLAVREAHFAKADSAAGLASALVALALATPWRARRARAIALGASAALAAATKSCFGLLVGPLHGLARPPGAPRRGLDGLALLVGGMAFALAMAALNPALIAHPSTIAANFANLHFLFSSANRLPGHDLVPGPLAYHARISLGFGCGTAMALLAVPAVAHALARGGARRSLGLAALGYAATLLASPMVLARVFLPLVPILAVQDADLVCEAAGRFAASRRSAVGAIALVALVAAAEPAARSIRLVELLGRPDTRALAADWLAANLPPNARVATWGAPTLFTDYGAPPLQNLHGFTRLPPGQWESLGVQYVIVHQYPLPYSSVPLPAGAPRLDRIAVFDPFDGPIDGPVLEPLDAFYLPLARFAGIARPGPRIEIYAVKY